MVEVVALRHPTVVLRRTTYAKLVFDERVLTRGFPWVERASLMALVLVRGRMRFGGTGDLEPLEVRPGDVVVLEPKDMARARLEDCCYVDLEWRPAVPTPTRVVASVDAARVARLADDLGRGADERALYTEAFELFAAAPLPIRSPDALTGAPTERDLRVARALSAQLQDLAGAATTKSLSELTDLSPRQLQRVLTDFSARYWLNATNWRDTRNRYRVQIAIALLGCPELTVATIAKEVGYRAPAALARALGNAGFPPPVELRAELARLAAVD